jgi:dTDP-4-amino-4,6-dideoxygalactose transaminase
LEIRREVLAVQKPLGGIEEVNALQEVIESGWWGKGPKVAEFEKKFAEMVGAKYAVAVTSATAGQDLVIKALGLNGVDIVSPTISFMTTAAVPLWNNCSTNIVDVDPINLNIDPLDVKKSLRGNTKVLIAVNLAGVPAPIRELREVFDGFILEDCAHSCYTPGAGTLSDAAVWSFQAVKTMPTGDGGMITTNNKDLYEKLIPLTWLGISSTFSRTSSDSAINGRPGYSWDYQIEVLGYKCYMIDLTAAIGLVQMKKLESNLEIRRHIQTRYNAELSPHVERPPWSETVQYYSARVDSNLRNELIKFLSEKNIHTSVHYKPLHLYPIVAQNRHYPVADVEWKRLISLPCHPSMNEDDVDYVIHWINSFFEANNAPKRR